MSQGPKAGKRLPLTLSQNKNSARKTSADVAEEKNEQQKSNATATSSDKKNDDTITATAINVDQLKAKNNSSTTDVKIKPTNKTTAVENGAAKNGTAMAKHGNANEDKTARFAPQIKLEKIKDSVQLLGAAKTTNIPEQKEENKSKLNTSKSDGATATDKNKKENGGPQKGEIIKENANKSNVKDEVKESSQKKEMSKTNKNNSPIEKVEQKESTPVVDVTIVTPITPDLTPSKDSPLKSSAKEENNTNNKIIDQSTNQQDLSTTPTTSTAAKKTATTSPEQSTTDSLILAKDLKGYGAAGQEMDSLITESEILIDSPMPKDKSTKILKYKQGPPPTRAARISPFRKMDKFQNTSTIVNLSTVSEQSIPEIMSTSPPSTINTSATSTQLEDDESSALKYGTGFRITGRRSTRPLAPITFQHHSLLLSSSSSSLPSSSYRRLPTAFDDTTASMNVTIGSENPADSNFSTPIGMVKGHARKRTADDATSMNQPFEQKDKSPKKARLDISGLLGVLASPITMLRAKFRRSNIQCSTPNEKLLTDNRNDSLNESEDNDNLNVSSIENDDEIMAEDGIESVPKINDNDKGAVNDVEVNVKEVATDDELKLNDKLQLDDEKDDFITDMLDDNEPAIEVREVKTTKCNVM